MTPQQDALFKSLIDTITLRMGYKTASDATPDDKNEQALTLLEALREKRFEFEPEIWHDARDTDGSQHFPSELLLRARTIDNKLIKPLAPITLIGELGLQNLLDKALILAATEQAIRKNQLPVSINTSARNMASPDFWVGIAQMLREQFPKDKIQGQLTFEVLEDDLASNPCREVLLEMKKEFGCRFAVDDFYHDRRRLEAEHAEIESTDWERLDNLKDIIDFVKIDGETVEDSLKFNDRYDLAGLIEKIRTVVPRAFIVLERVKNADEAYLLSYVGDAVQGLYLTHDRSDFKQELLTASYNFPPAPAPDKKKM
jgi:EAL domain-containing protein (putative c-di-GMP-specific phosphodiesterase class I)